MSNNDLEVEPCGDDLNTFVRILHVHGKALLKKNNTPDMKKKKEHALDAMQEALSKTGAKYNKSQIMRKVNNLRSRIKQKTDLKQSGNKRIVLSAAERSFYNMLSGDDNPTLRRVSCKFFQ